MRVFRRHLGDGGEGVRGDFEVRKDKPTLPKRGLRQTADQYRVFADRLDNQQPQGLRYSVNRAGKSGRSLEKSGRRPNSKSRSIHLVR